MAKSLLILVFVVAAACKVGVAVDIGVCYGMNGNDLPAPTDAIGLYKQYNIEKLRLFEPNHEAPEALRRSDIQVVLGVRNEDLPSIAATPDGAISWFMANVAPYVNDVLIYYIAAGNEVIPGEYGQYVAPAIQNLRTVLDANRFFGIQVTTVVSTAMLGSSFPPSGTVFTAEVASVMADILRVLSSRGASLMVNVYPYFAYASDPVNVRLDYAQFTASGVVVQDGDLSYSNLFDAMVDAFYWAIEKQGFTKVDVAVSETGWPSAGNGDFTTPDLASTYNKNLINHILNNKTPKRPETYMDVHIFALFNENLKPAGVEQNWGLFYPNMQPVYPVLN